MTGMTGAAISAVVAAALWPWVVRLIGARPRWVAVVTVLASGALGAVAAGQAVSWPARIGLVAFAAVAPWLVVTDLAAWRLPFELTLPAGALALAGYVASAVMAPSTLGNLIRALVAGALVAGLATALAMLAPSQLGGGDIAVLAVIALVLGWHGWTSLVTSLVSGFAAAAVAGVVIAIRTGSLKSRFPLGPFLVAGWVIAVVVGS